jgi:glycosyltransferase involved in cell wall biosynthesis
MKILIYTEYFFPIPGGVQTIVFELARGLAEWRARHPGGESFEVTVVTRTPEQTEEDDLWPFRLVRRPSLWRLLQLLHAADVIHLAGPALLPMAVGVVLRRPVVIEHHGYQSICPNGILLLSDRSVCPGHFMAGRYLKCVRCNSGDVGWLKSFLSLILTFPRRWLCRLASSNIAVSNHVAGRIALPRTRTILHGIRDCGPVTEVRLPQNGNAIQIGYVGRLVQEKGLQLFLDVAKRLDDDGFSFHLTFVGGGPIRKQLEDKSRGLGIAHRVTFTGDLAGADLERAVRPIQIVVIPSLCEETAGLAAIEQMMRGGVVLASDIGGLSEVVGDSGLKFVPGSSDALYANLRHVMETPLLAASIGSRARERAMKVFDSGSMIQAHVSVYRQVSQPQVQGRAKWER